MLYIAAFSLTIMPEGLFQCPPDKGGFFMIYELPLNVNPKIGNTNPSRFNCIISISLKRNLD
jgi:hypothetical protein